MSETYNILKKIWKKHRAMIFYLALIVTFASFILIISVAHERLLVGIFFSVLLFLIGAASGPVSIRLFGYYHVGFDLIPFVAISFFYTYDFMTGLLAAIGMNALSCIATKQFAIGHIVEMICYAIIGCLAFFVTVNPFVNGMVLVVVFNLLTYLFFYALRIASPNEWIRIAGNLLLHFVLFKYFGEIALVLI